MTKLIVFFQLLLLFSGGSYAKNTSYNMQGPVDPQNFVQAIGVTRTNQVQQEEAVISRSIMAYKNVIRHCFEHYIGYTRLNMGVNLFFSVDKSGQLQNMSGDFINHSLSDSQIDSIFNCFTKNLQGISLAQSGSDQVYSFKFNFIRN